ncbi:MAG TPA: glucan biosynthesis protein G [Methylomirabilota bacterium]|jgi:glucans biosynthesis protein|nr:glucan biosynthesis protein G [Methylomirabilota bacterium]
MNEFEANGCDIPASAMHADRRLAVTIRSRPANRAPATMSAAGSGSSRSGQGRRRERPTRSTRTLSPLDTTMRSWTLPLRRPATRRYCLCAVLLFCLGYLAATVAANAQFGFDDVADQAKKLAGEPFKPPPAVPDFLTRVSYDEYRDIRFDSARSLWKDVGGKFQVQLIHPGLFYRNAVAIHTSDGSGVSKVPFSPKLFTYGRNTFADKIPADLGFAGFRVAYPLHKKEDYNHVLVFAGASYFRAVAKNEVFGLSARGLAIDTGLPSGEEFPFFKEFWLERPARDATVMKIYALLDSQRVTGAYEFTLRPGIRTVVDVKATLFERKRAKELGIAPLTSMFLYGEERPRPAGEWRPEVHDSDGLMIQAVTGEWIWRPLVNPERLLVSYFELESPRGFGLLQRDRSFHGYEDLEARYELRPNAWITPLGSWGKGQVKLLEIPSQKESNDNIVAYWIPHTLPQVGQPIDIAYRIHFQSDEPIDASSGRATATRVGTGDTDGSKRIVIDFDGGKLKELPATAPVKAVITMGQDGQLVHQTAFKNSVTGGWRLAFQVKPPKDKALELRAFLKHDKDAVTETWSYRLTP